MTFEQEVRAEFHSLIEHLDKLYLLYGSGKSLLLDTKTIMAETKNSEFLKIVVRLHDGKVEVDT